ncbi:MAG: beta-hydroxyacyl-ACP dehydratase [Xanthobacteraceae bacterium]|nr:MAG: beta-hydroxyacyl-ACP dehydratase [Xanthobacteraceae bacterium]
MKLEYFQMIDRIAALDLDARTIAAEARIPEQSPVFEGHFPGYPLMPGVLLVEAMAQAAGWLTVALLRFEAMAFLAAIKAVKLRQFVTPGHDLAITARIEHVGSGFAVADAAIAVGGQPTCEATLTLRTLPFPTPALREHMAAAAARIGLAFPEPRHD